MAITARTADECVEKFRAHLAPLVASVFGSSSYFGKLDIEKTGTTSRVGFLQGTVLVPITIETRCGPLDFYVSQLVKAERVKGGKSDQSFRLSTLKYQYILAESVDSRAEVMRWEYDRVLPEGKLHCRHHLHQRHTIKLGTADFDLDKAHMPTGWVLLEEVFRFLIVELSLKPATPDWDDRLIRSTRKFHDSFT